MADKIILVDTSVLIDYYRKTDKEKTVWLSLVRQGFHFAISVVTKYEIYAGATANQITFWGKVLEAIAIIPIDENVVDTAVSLNTSLKKKRKQIEIADLFIAATAITHNLSFATLNKKHFERVDTINLIP